MITIRHTRAAGTLIEGSTKGDGVYEIVRPHGFHYFPSLQQIGIRRSRDRAAKKWEINAATNALRAAGFEVEIVIDEDDRRTFAEAEQDRYDRAEDRAERLQERACRAANTSQGLRDEAKRRRDAIPFGQPILVGHHSKGRDRRFRDRTHRMEGKAIAEGKRAAYLAGRADSAAHFQQYRRNPGVTLRRIAKLEAQLRRIHKWLDGKSAGGSTRALTPEGTAELHREEAETSEELTYWRTVIAQAEADGFKVWGKADFTKGDFALSHGRWYEVLRVNAKSLTVPGGPDIQPVISTQTRAYSWDQLLPYDGVSARRTADEMRAALPQVTDNPQP